MGSNLITFVHDKAFYHVNAKNKLTYVYHYNNIVLCLAITIENDSLLIDETKIKISIEK